ncbi:MAG TPA: thiamine pyrophosphate-dependent enzyme [Edaphobacter sp.]|nr:thiamine pyrophosphate-dependent enzyme [Edaphobacter sp.]
MSDTEMYENPLVPNAKLRQMYVAMAEARVLDEYVARLQKRAKGNKGRRRLDSRLDSIRGQEACRVSTAMDLGPGDLVSDSQVGVVMDLIAGAKVRSLLKRLAELESGNLTKGIKLGGTSGRLLPWIDAVGERLRMAMGAALSFKALRRPNVVVAYVRPGEVGKGGWRTVLELAASLELPMIFVVLPAGRGEKKDGVANLSARTARWGVPGIPVDTGDAVALYRVAQESLGRTRGGDGPVLIECVAHPAEGGGRSGTPGDPLVQMERFLLGRKVCSKAWLERAGDAMRRRIAAANQ